MFRRLAPILFAGLPAMASAQVVAEGAVAAGPGRVVLAAVVGMAAAAVVSMVTLLPRLLKRRRWETRHPVDLLVTLIEDGGTVTAQLTDLSRRGARLKLPAGLEPDSDTAICWHGHRMRARVIWSIDDYAGVRFDTPLSKAVFHEMLDVGAIWLGQAPVPAYRMATDTALSGNSSAKQR